MTSLVERSRRNLYINMVALKFIFKNNLITLCPVCLHTQNWYRTTQNRIIIIICYVLI